MQSVKVIIVLILALMITGCSVLDDYFQDEPANPTAAAMSESPPILTASVGNDSQLGTPMASCWPDGPSTLCRDFMTSADWFEQGDFLSISGDEPIVFEFVEGRPPNGVTINVYAEFPPSSPIETHDLAPASNTVTWQPSDMAAGDYYVMVFGGWENVETAAHYDSVYIVAVRVQ